MSSFRTRGVLLPLAGLGLAAWMASAPAHALTELTGIARIAASSTHSCVLTTAGGVKCWGSGSYGKLGYYAYPGALLPGDVAGLGSGVANIALGDNFSCALTNGGGVACWGDNYSGQLGDGSPYGSDGPRGVAGLASGVSAIAAGRVHACALTTGGGVRCWGTNSDGQLGNPAAGNPSTTPVEVVGLSNGVTAVVAGSYHTCALTTGGGVKCWGANYNGQLGDNGGSGFSSATPVDVTGLASGVTALAAGDNHTCAIVSGDALKCWGYNYYGQLGDNGASGFQSAVPVGVTGLGSGVAAVSAGGFHSCAVTTGGGVKCWGSNQDGQLGDNYASGYSGQPVPVNVVGLASGVAGVSAGSGHTCARLSAGGARCWGRNYSGQLGDNTTIPRFTPVDVLTNSLLTGIAGRLTVGGRHTCRVTPGGEAQCWGANEVGQVGDNTKTDRRVPVNVVGLSSGIAAISAGDLHTCAVTSGGGAKCWGGNFYGQLGEIPVTDRTAPVDVTGLTSGVAAIAAGAVHTCALTTGGGVKCWGSNANGRLGNNATTNNPLPVDVIGLPSGVKAIASGNYHSCALTTSGGVKCWGGNNFGQLGNNSTTDSLVPVDVAGLATGVTAISTGAYHTCALTNGGSLRCWGWNGWGQLGDNTTTDRPTPIDGPALAGGVVAVAAGTHHTCAITVAGGVKCWGYNGQGRLGNNSTTDSRIPVDVFGLATGAIAIGANYFHSCALTAAGSVKCWGANLYGQLGNNATTDSLVPVDALLPRAASTVSVNLSSGVNPSARGQPLTFYAYVSATVPGLTGVVTFKDGGAVIPGCGPTLVLDPSGYPTSQRVAYCNTATLGPGTHTITAEYGGSADILPAVSAAYTQTVIAIDPFLFADQNDVGLGVLATSNPVTLTGFSGSQPISISNGTYSINCTPPYLSAPGTVTAGTTVCVHHVTPLALGMDTTTTLTVGAVSSSFRSYTTYDSPLTPPARIAAGISHNLVIADDVANDYSDALWAWGDNTAGKLGIGSTVTTSIPSRAFYGSVMNMAAGMSHSLALDFGGRVYSWGLNRDGQLGADPAIYGTFYCKVPGETGLGPGGTFFCRPEPVQVPGLDNIVAVSAGWGHSLALKSDGTVWAWGSGIYGQNGDAGFLDRKSPVQVPISGMVTRIAAGYFHSVALRSDGTVVVWGQGSHGELGPASLAPKTATPVAVTGLTGVTDIAAGGAYTLARKSDLSLVAWGSNVYGTLGDFNSYSFRQSPAPVAGMTNVEEFTAGFGFALARKTGGSVWGWGLNNRGQLTGTPQTTPNNCGLATGRSCILAPTQISSLGGATRIVAGGAHTLTVRPSQALVIIGDNASGQHGDKSGNYGVPYAAGRPPFVQELYDPDTFTNPAGTFGTPGGVGTSGTAGGLNLGSLSDGIAFGPQGVGIPSSALAVTLNNLSETDTITVTSATAAGDAVAGEFSATGCIGTLSVAPSTCTINVVFNPADLGARYGTLTITSNAANSGTMSFPLQGTGVDPRPTSTTTLSANANPISAGTSVTFTAVVSASPIPAGTVAFRDGGATIAGCGAVPLSGGSAGCTTSALAAGVRNITASYLDGGSAQPSTSSTLTMSVLAPNTLTVTKSGAGSGTVASSPAGIDCGATCSANFANGTPVTLTAEPATGSVFTGWGGDCSGAGACLVTMTAARSVTATFALQSLSLSVTSTGSGTVTSIPSGIGCATCSASFPFGTTVTLSAAPGAGYQFSGWGGACSGTGSCVVTIDAAKSVTASFTPLPPVNFALAVTLAGGGTGTVTSNPAGINCGATCTTNFGSGAPVTLTAVAGAGSTFTGWSGSGCSGTGTCVVTMSSAQAVTATFAVQQFALTASKAGGGSGVINSTPSGIDCGATCQASFATGTTVSLSAVPDAGSFFAGWSGDCTGTGTCNVTMSAARSVTATFKLLTTIPRLVNLATRMQVGIGDNVLIGGLVIGGAAPKTVVIRARGPSLSAAGVQGVMANPKLDIYSGQTLIASNDNWGVPSGQAAAIEATGFQPLDPNEAAVLLTLTPGGYTAVVSGVSGTTGIALIEAFEVDLPQVPLINIATRGFVQSGDNVMIGGFVILGDAPQTVIIRARGPSLTAVVNIANPLLDPVLSLYSGQTLLRENDNWANGPQAAEIQARGYAPTNASESAILMTLQPGGYTAIVSGANNSTGVALIEVFAVPATP